MTAWQRALGENFLQMLFLDAKPNSFNTVSWPFFAPSIIDEEGVIRAICFVLAATDGGETVNKILTTIKKWIPKSQKSLRSMVSDAAITEFHLRAVFPNADLLLCKWHLEATDLPRQLSQIPGWESFKIDLKNALFNVETKPEFNAIWDTYSPEHATFKGQSPRFMAAMTELLSREREWANYSTMHRASFGKNSNLAEIMNAKYQLITQSKVLEPINFVNLLIESLQQDMANLKNMLDRRNILESSKHYAPYVSDTATVKKLRPFFSDFALKTFAEEEAESFLYIGTL